MTSGILQYQIGTKFRTYKHIFTVLGTIVFEKTYALAGQSKS